MNNTNFTYKKLVNEILETGELREGRNGNMLFLPFYSFQLDFSVDNPLITLRKMYTKGIDAEFKVLTNSEEPLTNVKQFKDEGCNYWDIFADEDGSINLDYYNKLNPYLNDLCENIKNDRFSRRHVLSLWDNENVKQGVLNLPCCWHGLTFNVSNDGSLNLVWTQRSVDVMVGLPTDMYLANKFMEYVIERVPGLKKGKVMFSLSNVHIYEEHIDNARILLGRDDNNSDNPLKFVLKL